MRKIIITILLVLAAVFVLENTQNVSITFISWHLSLPLALIIGIGLGVGLCIGILILLPSIVRQKLKISGHNKEISALMSKIEGQDTSKSKNPDSSADHS
ncbi:MAG TPA: LapA family protein [Burkholderiales bacterium]|nr:LapA family protein [Burkholderiales bacterium]